MCHTLVQLCVAYGQYAPHNCTTQSMPRKNGPKGVLFESSRVLDTERSYPHQCKRRCTTCQRAHRETMADVRQACVRHAGSPNAPVCQQSFHDLYGASRNRHLIFSTVQSARTTKQITVTFPDPTLKIVGSEECIKTIELRRQDTRRDTGGLLDCNGAYTRCCTDTSTKTGVKIIVPIPLKSAHQMDLSTFTYLAILFIYGSHVVEERKNRQ